MKREGGKERLRGERGGHWSGVYIISCHGLTRSTKNGRMKEIMNKLPNGHIKEHTDKEKDEQT